MFAGMLNVGNTSAGSSNGNKEPHENIADFQVQRNIQLNGAVFEHQSGVGGGKSSSKSNHEEWPAKQETTNSQSGAQASDEGFLHD